MKKNLATSLFLLVFVIIFTSCTSVSSNKIAYRVFYLSREQDNGNLSLNTDSDIPNGYECILEENMVLDSGGNEMIYVENFSNSLVDGENGFKVLKFSGAGKVFNNAFQETKQTFNDVGAIRLKYFCVSPDLLLNDELLKGFGSL